MGLVRYRLGELIELESERNTNGMYTLDDVRGISIQKIFIDTKADMSGVSLLPYIIVKPNTFAYVPVTSRNGEKITIAYNYTDKTYIVSTSYVVFSVKRTDILLPDYLFMYFNRAEFDRYARFHSWGSAREAFSWEDMCDVVIDLPPVEIQRKYARVYLAVKEQQRVLERGQDDLKLVCDMYIEDLRRKMPCERIGGYITERNDRNTELQNCNVKGVSSDGDFIETRADTLNLDFSNYKIVKNDQFAYNPARINIGSIALLNGDDCIVSPMYVVFEITDKEKLLPEYLMLWFRRREFQRSTLFYATGSVRDIFLFDLMCNVSIPIPDISIQRSIANIYSVYQKRKAIAERLKSLTKTLCPILIKGAIDDAQKSISHQEEN